MKKTLNRFLKVVSAVIPLSAIVLLYHGLCKVPLLSQAVQAFMRLVIPETISFEGGMLTLNRDDVVVSGSLALNIYEKHEVLFFLDTVKAGMTVFDVGANIGLYSVLAGRKVGAEGKVFSFEPDPVNFNFLRKNIDLNNLKNVMPVNKAVTSKSDDVKLFLSKENFGDHSLYNTEIQRNSISVPGVSLDDFVREMGLKSIDLIKLDIQGAEGLALQGMKEILNSVNAPKLFIEYYPYGLKKMGIDPLQILTTLENYNYEIFVIDEVLKKVDDRSEVVKNVNGKKYLNLFARKK